MPTVFVQEKINRGTKIKSMVESPGKGHKRRHGELPVPDHDQENEDERGPREKKKKNDNNSEVCYSFLHPLQKMFIISLVQVTSLTTSEATLAQRLTNWRLFFAVTLVLCSCHS